MGDSRQRLKLIFKRGQIILSELSDVRFREETLPRSISGCVDESAEAPQLLFGALNHGVKKRRELVTCRETGSLFCVEGKINQAFSS